MCAWSGICVSLGAVFYYKGHSAVMAEWSRSRSRSPWKQGPHDVLIYASGSRELLCVNGLKRLHGVDSHVAVVRFAPQQVQRVPNGMLCDWRFTDDCFSSDKWFHWADKELYVDSLGVLHPTPRDCRCVFVESTHCYYVDGLKVPWSGTTLAHYCHVQFDADAVLATYLPKPGWATMKGFVREDGSEMNADEIKDLWARNGMAQSRRGTLLHWQIECYFNGYAVEKPHSPEFAIFLQFERFFLDVLGLTPWRVEMNLFHCGLRLAGQADLICKDHGGRLVILDWKRSKQIKDWAFNDEMQNPPLDHLPNSNRHCYNLQLNVYRHILESEYGFEVSGMYLVVLHPDQMPNVPHVYIVPVLADEIAALVNCAVVDLGVSAVSFPGADAAFDLSDTWFASETVPALDRVES